MPLILDGKKVRGEIAKTLRRKVEAFSPKPKLAIVQVGTNKESSAYVRQKKKFGESIGVLVDYLKAPEFITESELILKLKELNADSSVSGIIVQLPLPSALSVEKTINAIDPEKDVDGLTAVNEQLFKEGKPRFIPATARGIIELLEWYHLPLFDAKVAVLGRSKLVGAPTALLLKKKGALVTVCHSKTPNTKTITRRSDIIIVAIGKPKLITAEYIRRNRTQTVIDVGINARTEVGEAKLLEEIPRSVIVGDVDFDEVKDKVAAISPVPGGVGPMTVAALFENVVSAYEMQTVPV
ncbi:MAG: hypothetical protein A2W52_04330 [Candidatus Taylorbacteria bacterium RIFCSPHIGHO2_02_49_25]|uniref:Bifunctional protein FolD n=1 Tax=Candidatus Taylorbacteria bacterium RIFCSPHIGHO2_02_49_25 TaxID=1802305 RepID=A0A1G2MFJ4_9BACT|nr:MAG: Bifunctional protein FolD [Parcubacteria group bacterium GW2011_GWF2_50_9]OHA22648.1 MAG: hypothetical protein A2W52_04330 [Candidatus Taylorbacteria bacterium RIFCSPHIGHO2_02_49_25]OHA36240.1 MAG: hypothetical protein A3B27_00175 [Candidatus Taylorbacteria bacterium RIFCSPLOWO2_01_FULL_50_130]OHA36534.1 MAG: hypothetical protein A2W65_04495 [Candidatus Taylorbacteria bacterium RIFCSPLOWO2_02_50_13]OHA48189.1 MAG: hypothetical protein A3G61_04660 [Candidatus Taylorbacteria bacterium RIF